MGGGDQRRRRADARGLGGGGGAREGGEARHASRRGRLVSALTSSALTLRMAARSVHVSMSALHQAVTAQNPSLIRSLVAGGEDVNNLLCSVGSPLCLAALLGAPAVIETLIECGADVALASSKGGASPLHFCLSQNHLAATLSLIKAGAPANARNNNGETPLHIWVRKLGANAILQALVVHGADLEARDSSGHTPLMVAVINSASHWTSLLLAAGANPNCTDDLGSTALHLHCATYNRSLALTRTLVEGGADPTLLDAQGRLPIDIARKDDDWLAHGGDITAYLAQGCSCKIR